MTQVLLVNRNDFECVTQLSTHCDWDVMDFYITERQNMDLCGLIGQPLLIDVIENRGDEKYDNLLNGCKYEGCDGLTYNHFGLKRVLVHFSYAAYVYRKGFVDTPFAVVQKMHKDSIPVPTNELRSLHNEHRKIANEYWQMTKNFLCNNTKIYPLFDNCDCTPCSSKDKCGGKCRGSRTKSIRRNKIKVISK